MILFYTKLQDSVNIVEEVKKINCSQPFLLVLEGDDQFNYVIMCENSVFLQFGNLTDGLFFLLAVYYIFDMSYPKPLYPVYIFLQHHVFSLLDKAHIPDVVIRTLSVLHNINWPPFIVVSYLVYWHTSSTLNSFDIIIIMKYNIGCALLLQIRV